MGILTIFSVLLVLMKLCNIVDIKLELALLPFLAELIFYAVFLYIKRRIDS